MRDERGWPGKSSVDCLMKQITLLSGGSSICKDENGDMSQAFADKLHEKIHNDNKKRRIKMQNDTLRGDVINALLLI